MKSIAIGAVTAGGKTTLVHALQSKLPRSAALYFDDYTFDGAVEDYSEWVASDAYYDVWDLSPLRADIEQHRQSGKLDYLLLDYPFAYRNAMLQPYLDCCIFLDTPLDIALARRVLRDQKAASADEIRQEMTNYLQFARPAYVQMQIDILPSSDYVLDGAKPLEQLLQEALHIIESL